MANIDLTQTVSPVEVVWVLSCLMGCIVAAGNWREANLLKFELDRSGRNGLMLLEAKGSIQDQKLIFVAILSELCLGLFSLVSVPGANSSGGPSIGSIFGPWVLIIGCISLIRLSLVQRSRREQRTRMLDALDNAMIKHGVTLHPLLDDDE